MDCMREMAVILVSLAGAYAAIAGIQTWRTQLIGTASYDLARKLLRSVLLVEQEFRYARSPMVTQTEEYAAVKAKDESLTAAEVNQVIDPFKGDRKRTRAAVYERRFAALIDSFLEFDANLLEAEVLWNEDMKSCRNRFRSQVNQYEFAVRDELGDRNDLPKDRVKEVHEIIYRTSGESDAMSREVAKEVERIRQLCRPHLDVSKRLSIWNWKWLSGREKKQTVET